MRIAYLKPMPADVCPLGYMAVALHHSNTLINYAARVLFISHKRFRSVTTVCKKIVGERSTYLSSHKSREVNDLVQICPARCRSNLDLFLRVRNSTLCHRCLAGRQVLMSFWTRFDRFLFPTRVLVAKVFNIVDNSIKTRRFIGVLCFMNIF